MTGADGLQDAGCESHTGSQQTTALREAGVTETYIEKTFINELLRAHKALSVDQREKTRSQ